MIKLSGKSAFDINVRSMYVSLQFGREALARFCGILDLPPPVLQPSYSKISNNLSMVSRTMAEVSMKEVAQRLVEIIMDRSPDDIQVEEDGRIIANVAVTIDGTWQKRGHASKHGVVSREYKREKKGQKQADGKGVGAGRLTDPAIDRIRNNYGEAIRNSTIQTIMKTTILAVYHHMIRDDSLSLNEQHKYCPIHINTWCKYWQDNLHNTCKYTLVYQQCLKLS